MVLAAKTNPGAGFKNYVFFNKKKTRGQILKSVVFLESQIFDGKMRTGFLQRNQIYSSRRRMVVIKNNNQISFYKISKSFVRGVSLIAVGFIMFSLRKSQEAEPKSFMAPTAVVMTKNSENSNIKNQINKNCSVYFSPIAGIGFEGRGAFINSSGSSSPNVQKVLPDEHSIPEVSVTPAEDPTVQIQERIFIDSFSKFLEKNSNCFGTKQSVLSTTTSSHKHSLTLTKIPNRVNLSAISSPGHFLQRPAFLNQKDSRVQFQSKQDFYANTSAFYAHQTKLLLHQNPFIPTPNHLALNQRPCSKVNLNKSRFISHPLIRDTYDNNIKSSCEGITSNTLLKAFQNLKGNANISKALNLAHPVKKAKTYHSIKINQVTVSPDLAQNIDLSKTNSGSDLGFDSNSDSEKSLLLKNDQTNINSNGSLSKPDALLSQMSHLSMNLEPPIYFHLSQNPKDFIEHVLSIEKKMCVQDSPLIKHEKEEIVFRNLLVKNEENLAKIVLQGSSIQHENINSVLYEKKKLLETENKVFKAQIKACQAKQSCLKMKNNLEFSELRSQQGKITQKKRQNLYQNKKKSTLALEAEYKLNPTNQKKRDLEESNKKLNEYWQLEGISEIKVRSWNNQILLNSQKYLSAEKNLNDANQELEIVLEELKKLK